MILKRAEKGKAGERESARSTEIRNREGRYKELFRRSDRRLRGLCQTSREPK